MSVRSLIRYLEADAVRACLPTPDAQITLVEDGYRMLSRGGADIPATPEVAPRPGAFGHAKPAYVGERDITAVKWICGSPHNRAKGLPYLSGVIVLNDSETGLPIAIMDAAVITAARTAAVSATCARHFGAPGWKTLGIIGYGVQAEAHETLFTALFPDVQVHVFSRTHAPRADGANVFTTTARSAVEHADVIVTSIPLEARLTPPLEADWLTANAPLVLPIDDDASVAPSVSLSAARYYVDDLGDYAIRKRAGTYLGWREPDGSVADGLSSKSPRNELTLCLNQGQALFDALFADAVARTAIDRNAGSNLRR